MTLARKETTLCDRTQHYQGEIYKSIHALRTGQQKSSINSPFSLHLFLYTLSSIQHFPSILQYDCTKFIMTTLLSRIGKIHLLRKFRDKIISQRRRQHMSGLQKKHCQLEEKFSAGKTNSKKCPFNFPFVVITSYSDLLLNKHSNNTIKIGIFYLEDGEKYGAQEEELNE